MGRAPLILLLTLIAFSHGIRAQDPPRFAPKAPPLEQEFEDPSDDDEAAIGEPPKGAMPPPSTSGAQSAPPPPQMTDFRPAPAIDASKVKFKLVDGEFYEKGKKRGRTPQNNRTQ